MRLVGGAPILRHVLGLCRLLEHLCLRPSRGTDPASPLATRPPPVLSVCPGSTKKKEKEIAGNIGGIQPGARTQEPKHTPLRMMFQLEAQVKMDHAGLLQRSIIAAWTLGSPEMGGGERTPFPYPFPICLTPPAAAEGAPSAKGGFLSVRVFLPIYRHEWIPRRDLLS